MNLPFELFIHLLWTILRMAYESLQYIVWLCNGTQAKIRKNFGEGPSEECVQVLDIFARHKFCDILQPSASDNFLMTHKGFVHPDYVLQDHISLYYIQKSEAVFVEAEEGVDVTLSRYGSFVRTSQYKQARRFIIMPISAFHRLGEKLGQTSAKIIFLCNTSRCGSTLVTQVFEETGSSIAYSEPDAINALTQLKGVVSEAERVRIFKNCINLMCKPCHTKKIESYVFKPTQPTMAEMPFIAKLFPESSVMFLYRDGLKCSKSNAKICNEVRFLGLVVAIARRSAKLSGKMFDKMGLPSKQFEVRMHSGIHFGSIVWAFAMKQYIDFRESGLKIVGVRYEDIVDDTTYAFQKVFEYCNLPYDARAVEAAMGRDSQRSSAISMQNLAKYNDEEFTAETKKHTDRVCDQFGLPCFPEPFIVPGTITHRDRNLTNGK